MNNTKIARLSAVLGVLLAAPAVQAQASAEGEFTPRTRFERVVDPSRDAVPEIQAHLAAVIADLEARDVSRLSHRQQGERRRRIAELADYAARGVFPQNELAPFPTPVFIDDGGRACAVGHLMLTSGAEELARRIARVENTAYVAEIQTDGAAEWMASSGLTLEECEMIQPTYWPCGSGGAQPNYTTSCWPTVPNSNPFGTSAFISPCGTGAVASGRIALHVGNVPLGTTGYFLVSRSLGPAVQPAGSQGTLCLGGAIGRSRPFVTTQALGGAFVENGGIIILGLDRMPSPSGPAGVVPGDTWHFQAWYRDMNPGPTSNFSAVASITFS